MKKLIMMAIAGFVWKKVQARILKQPQAVPARGVRRL
ncbi:MAG: hypothetical protein JWP59_984 [Massilia sp.]|nr:hypothetical protein [Massilia sp.]